MSTGSNRVTWAVGALLVVGALGLLIGLGKMLGYDPMGPARSHSPLVGAPAPEVSLALVSGHGSDAGDRISVSSLRGEVVLLDFWASWCHPCRQSIPALNQVHERYGSRIRMYGVNVQPELRPDGVRAAHRDFGADFPSLHDARQEAQSLYGVTSIPTLVMIDRDGVVRHVERGVPDPDDVAARLDEILTDR